MVAQCYYNETPVYSLDATNNYKSIKELQSFINRYPLSDRVEECNTLLDELRVVLSKKAFENAKQYYITENYKSAIIALDNVLIDFPSYKNREEVHFLIVKSSYLLAINSVSTKVEERLKSTHVYSQFEDNYPKSKFLEDLKNTHYKTMQSLTELKEKNNEI
jgi:outer membrane protein assembly factor BamD